MAAATSFASDYHWISTGSRRNSIESVLSIQGRETDIVRDTSDTDGFEEESGAEFEPVTEPEDDDGPVKDESSGESDNIIKTRVISVCVRDDGDLVLADSEETSSGSDAELALPDYWRCAQCGAQNNTPLYRYCQSCFKGCLDLQLLVTTTGGARSAARRITPRCTGTARAASRSTVASDDYWRCAQCGAQNNTPLYRYCQSCFKRCNLTYTLYGSDRRLKEKQRSLRLAIVLDRRYIQILQELLQGEYVMCQGCLELQLLVTTTGGARSAALRITPRSIVTARAASSSGSDAELALPDYWRCAQCGAQNNTPLYRYCQSCFKVRKNFFPPRPKRKHSGKQSRDVTDAGALVHTLSQTDSGVGTDATSQELTSSQDSRPHPSHPYRLDLKRRAESDSDSDQTDIERTVKRKRSRKDVAPLVKTVSDPALTIDNFVVDSKESATDNLCIICFSEPKSGVFVHGRIAHICCCYKCAVKVWSKAKRCPICNCKVSNVLKAVVM
ncbi:unnamed protein product [Plutella xylostella]|uniref:(diamondback moth) hypothetical protein n=1 Tax=Plutella xylostella TaxID=51655 RepID=A0A8S4FXW3_PLUXY|nr:unnamed protein product [Plutella xylostella]